MVFDGMQIKIHLLHRTLLWGGFALALVFAPWMFHQGRALSILCQMGTLMIFGLSFNMLLGQGGMLSLGHSIYSGMGAFFAIHAMNMMRIGTLVFPVTLLPLLGGLAGMFFGALFGYVSTKKSGTTFAMITLGLVELVFAGAAMLPEFFGGEGGVSANRVIGPPLLGITFGPQIQVYYLIAFWLLMSTVAMYAFTQTPLGRILNAVRDNPERVEFIGYDPRWVRYLTFILAAFFAGISGGLTAINFEMATSENLSVMRSASILLFTFIGGIGFFWGPMIGVFFCIVLSVMLSDMTKAWQLYLAIIFIVIVLFSPGGIASFLARHFWVAKHRKYHRIGWPFLAFVLFALLALMGTVMMIEMSYHRALGSEEGTTRMLLFFQMDSAQPFLWVIALFLTACGTVGLRHISPVLREKWHTVNTEIEDQVRMIKS